MTTEHSTYTYEGGEQETVTLKRGTGTPHGYALLTIKHSDGEFANCYVNTAWLRDRLDDLGEPRRTDPRPITPDAITDEMVERAMDVYIHAEGTPRDAWRAGLAAALTEPPARPEGAKEIEKVLDRYRASTGNAALADRIAEEMDR